MSDIRSKFEEIWPVPHGIGWNTDHGRYMVLGRSSLSSGIAAVEYQARLDTFTRCQETTAIYISLIEDLASSLGMYIDGDDCNEVEEGNEYWRAEQVLSRAKQVMERLK